MSDRHILHSRSGDSHSNHTLENFSYVCRHLHSERCDQVLSNKAVTACLDPFRSSTVYLFIRLTRAVGVDHETLVDVVLDEQKSLLKDLPGTCLLHCVGVTWIPEKS